MRAAHGLRTIRFPMFAILARARGRALWSTAALCGALAGCGAPPITDNPSPGPEVGAAARPILNGTGASSATAVWIVTSDGRRCSGALLTNSWVLTAASCVRTSGTTVIDATVGVTSAGGQNLWPQLAEEIIIHPHAPYDVALVRLAQGFPLGAQGASTGFELNAYPGHPAALVGQLVTCRGYRHGAATPTLLEARLPVTQLSGGDTLLEIGGNALGQRAEYGDWGMSCFTLTPDGREATIGVLGTCTGPTSTPTSCTLLSAAAIRHWIAEARVQVDLIPKSNSSAYLFAPDDPAQMAGLTIWQNATRERFRLLPRPDGTFNIRSLHPISSRTGPPRCLCTTTNVGTRTDLVQQCNCNAPLAGFPMTWRLIQDAGGLQIQNAGSGKCLDVTSNPARQAPCNALPTQRFEPTVHVDEGAHWLWQLNRLLCGGIAGGSLATGARFTQAACTGVASQLVRFEKVSGGTYRLLPSHANIAGAAPQRCLEIPGGSLASGVTLEQGACAVHNKQHFKLQFRPSGLSFRLQSALSSLCVDGAAPGEAGKTAPCTESPTQFWRLAL